MASVASVSASLVNKPVDSKNSNAGLSPRGVKNENAAQNKMLQVGGRLSGTPTVYFVQHEGQDLAVLVFSNGQFYVLKNSRYDSESGAGFGNLGAGGMDGVGHAIRGSNTRVTTFSGGAASGVGAGLSLTLTTVTNARGEVVNEQITSTGTVRAGVSPPGGSATSEVKPGIHLNQPGISPVADVEFSLGPVSVQGTFNMKHPGESALSVSHGVAKPSATVGTGLTHTTRNGCMCSNDGNSLGLSTSNDNDHSGHVGGLW